MNLEEWMSSKKTKHYLIGLAFIALFLGACLYVSGGDPEKFKALLEAAKEYVWSAVGLGAAAIVGQSAVDREKAKPAARPTPDKLPAEIAEELERLRAKEEERAQRG